MLDNRAAPTASEIAGPEASAQALQGLASVETLVEAFLTAFRAGLYAERGSRRKSGFRGEAGQHRHHVNLLLVS
jgi:hypothetical protein